MIFISAPYSDPDCRIKEQRAEATAKTCAILMNKGFLVCCPLLQGLAVIEKSGMHLPDDYDYWQHFCNDFVRACSEMWVLTINGYHTSKGVEGEVMAAHELGIPVNLFSVDLDHGMICDHGPVLQDDNANLHWPDASEKVWSPWATR